MVSGTVGRAAKASVSVRCTLCSRTDCSSGQPLLLEVHAELQCSLQSQLQRPFSPKYYQVCLAAALAGCFVLVGPGLLGCKVLLHTNAVGLNVLEGLLLIAGAPVRHMLAVWCHAANSPRLQRLRL